MSDERAIVFSPESDMRVVSGPFAYLWNLDTRELVAKGVGSLTDGVQFVPAVQLRKGVRYMVTESPEPPFLPDSGGEEVPLKCKRHGVYGTLPDPCQYCRAEAAERERDDWKRRASFLASVPAVRQSLGGHHVAECSCVLCEIDRACAAARLATLPVVQGPPCPFDGNTTQQGGFCLYCRGAVERNAYQRAARGSA